LLVSSSEFLLFWDLAFHSFCRPAHGLLPSTLYFFFNINIIEASQANSSSNEIGAKEHGFCQQLQVWSVDFCHSLLAILLSWSFAHESILRCKVRMLFVGPFSIVGRKWWRCCYRTRESTVSENPIGSNSRETGVGWPSGSFTVRDRQFSSSPCHSQRLLSTPTTFASSLSLQFSGVIVSIFILFSTNPFRTD
jgi:hypothetical protein